MRGWLSQQQRTHCPSFIQEVGGQLTTGRYAAGLCGAALDPKDKKRFDGKHPITCKRCLKKLASPTHVQLANNLRARGYQLG